MEEMTLGFVQDAVGGELPPNLSREEARTIKLRGLSSDTRRIAEKDLYLALRGERFDGNAFLTAAFEKGASAAVAERFDETQAKPVLRVKDTRRALLDLAAAYRRLFAIPVVGVTGSVGKTSTKEMIYAVLSQGFTTHKNEGNLNNEIGMPTSVFGLEKRHGAAVFEMGMSGFGEIARMTRVAAPTVGVITNIGISHIEKLGSQENILRAKLEICEGMKPGSTLVVNGDDAFLQTVRPQGGIIRMTYGVRNTACDVFADEIEADGFSTRFTLHAGGRGLKAALPVCGRHNVYNALAAFCCGVVLGLSPEQAAAGFAAYSPSGMRQRIERLRGVTLVEDCYNASPDSMHSAFDVLNTAAAGGRKLAVLADMLELGEKSREAHLHVGEKAAQSGVELLLAFGPYASYYCEGFEKAKSAARQTCQHFDDKADLVSRLLAQMREGDAILFKGSRGMRLEEAIERIREGWKTK